MLLAVGAFTNLINPSAVLACIFALGIGLAFGAPVWGAVVPDIVSKDELPSAITLGGVQLNLSGIVGPALGGFLLPVLGAPVLISFNALAFVLVAFVIMQWKPRQAPSTRLRENFTESFISSLRYARNSQRMKVILFRNVLFSVVISAIPGALAHHRSRACACSASQLGLIFASVGVGSLGGAMFVLPFLRKRFSANAITSISVAILLVVYLAMASYPRGARSDGLDGPCRRCLVAGGLRALGCRAAGDAQLGSREDERVPDHAGAGRNGARGHSLGDRCGQCRS